MPIRIKKFGGGGGGTPGTGEVQWQPPFHGIAPPTVTVSDVSLGDFELEPQLALEVVAALADLQFVYNALQVTGTPLLSSVEVAHDPVSVSPTILGALELQFPAALVVGTAVLWESHFTHNAATATATSGGLTAAETVHNAAATSATLAENFMPEAGHDPASTTLAVAGTATKVETFTASDTWSVPAGLVDVTVKVWGKGGGGGTGNVTNRGGGGGGGAFAQTDNPSGWTAGDTITLTIPATANTGSQDTWASDTGVAPANTTQGALAKGGARGADASGVSNGAGGAGGTAAASIGTTKFSGGAGGTSSSGTGPGGGGGAGDAQAGTNGGGSSTSVGVGGTADGGNGGQGGTTVNGAAGAVHGGGGGGGNATTGTGGGNGARGKIEIHYTVAL